MGRVQAQVETAPAPPVDSLEMLEHRSHDQGAEPDTLVLSPACWGEELAQAAREAANSYREKPGERLCYRYVKQAVSQALGLSLSGPSAYLAARQLADSKHFEEAQWQPGQLGGLPAGSIVVWGRSKKHPHGHISVADGQGREISDRVRPQITSYGTKLKVFVPRCSASASPP